MFSSFALDPRTLAASYVLLSSMLGVLLLWSWWRNQRIQALKWWGAAFCLIPCGIGAVNLEQGPPGHLTLLVANALVTLGYGTLYVGCNSFNERPRRMLTGLVGTFIWVAAFPIIHETFSARLVLMALILGGYAALSAWELWKHAPRPLASQHGAVMLLAILAAFNLTRGIFGLPLGSLFGFNVSTSRWSTEMALFLVVYAPTLAFVFLSMAKEQAELALRESEDHYRFSVELNPQIPWTADPQGNILDISVRWHGLFNMRREEALGQGWMAALHPDDVLPTTRLWQDALLHRHSVDTEYRLRLADGSYRWFRARGTPRLRENGTVIRWYGSVEDIHDRKLAQQQLHWAAHHDDLTGLANRRLFLERLKQAPDQSVGPIQMVGLLVMDLDHLKIINDRFGHDAGDALLQEFAARLRSLARTTDTVARLGGDEFAIILTDVPGEAYVAAVAASILARMREPFRYRDQILDCRTSIGGAVSAGSVMDMDEFQKQADLALFRCKASKRGTFEMYRADMREEAQRTASALEVARKAVASNWIVPFYQPKVALETGLIKGFEALLRWQHPRMGIHLPETIAPAFDDTDLGRAIGASMLSSVLEDMRAWIDAGVEIGRVAINASAAEFRHDDYAEHVLEELRRVGVPTSCLEIEVTESVFMGRSAGSVERALRALSAAGVVIALDDFGTGYASLANLKQFPVDVIKIDRSFIRDMATDASDTAIVKALLGLGQSLGIKVVAEGIETVAQAAFLRKSGCDLGQGYYFGHAIPAQAIPELIASRTDDVGKHGWALH